MCFRITTLSHFEAVSCNVWGSSSSQSVNFLQSISADSPWIMLTIRIHLGRPFDNLLLVLVIRLRRCFLLTLVREVRSLYPHLACWSFCAQSEICIVKHLNRKIHGLGSEEDDESIALELSLIVLIHLDPCLARVDLLCDDAAFREDVLDFFLFDVERE